MNLYLLENVETVVYWPPTRENMPFQRRRELHIPLAWVSLADNMGQGYNPTVQSQTDAPEEGDMWTAWQLFPLDDDQNMPFQRRRKWIFLWPFMGRDWVGVNYYITQCTGNSTRVWRSERWRNYPVEKTAPSRELGPRASGWTTLENEKDTLLCPEALGRSICCISATPSHIQPFQIKWGLYFSKNCVARLHCVVVMILYVYVFVLLVMVVTIQQNECMSYNNMWNRS